MALNNHEDLYKVVNEFQESLAKLGFPSKPEESIDPIKEIPKINKRLERFNQILAGIIMVLGLAFLGFIIDAIYFHINNSKYFDNIYDLKNNQQQQIDNVKNDLNNLKEKHPELFK